MKTLEVILVALNGVFVSVYVWYKFFFVEGIEMAADELLSTPSNDLLIAWGFIYAFGLSAVAVGVILYAHWWIIEQITKGTEEHPTSAKIGW